MTLQQIENQIKNIPLVEARNLHAWLEEYLADKWDAQIAEDAVTGRLDHLLAKVQADIAAGRTKDL